MSLRRDVATKAGGLEKNSAPATESPAPSVTVCIRRHTPPLTKDFYQAVNTTETYQ